MGKITAFCSKNTTEFSEISRWRWSECWGGDSPTRHCRFVPATVKTVPANVGERHAAPGDALAVRTNRRQNGNSLRFVIARRPQADVAISGRQLRFRRKCPVIHPGSARLPRAQSALAMTNLLALRHRIRAAKPTACKALNPRKGDAASVRRQSRQRLRSERRYRRNRCVLFYRQPLRIAAVAPGAACRSPTMACTG